MSKLLEKIKKNTTIKEADILEQSKFFDNTDCVSTKIPALNIALSGSLDGGFSSGLYQWCGPSKHFKSMFALLMAKSFMDKHEDGVLLFYDCEFGAPKSYFNSLGIDMSRVMHLPIENLEQLKFDLANQLTEFDRKDKVIIIIDSIGNIASKKELDDALDEKSVADMSRAKQITSLFRIVTPMLTTKDIPMIAINHTMEEIGLFARTVAKGGKGIEYSSDNIYFLSRRQEKDGTDLLGYSFVITVEKSRHVVERSKIPITVKFEGGLSVWSGLLDIALEAGKVVKPSNGWYSRVLNGITEDKKWRLKDTNCKEFWLDVLSDKDFCKWVENRYKVSNGVLIADDEIQTELESVSLDDF